MTWFKVDDSFWGHPKRMRCTPSAIGLWVTAGSWSAQQLMDGKVPAHVLPMLGKPADARQLASAGLWEKVDDGYLFHDWADWQPTKQQVTDRRDAEARRKQEWRDRKARKRAGDADVPPGHTRDETRDTDGTETSGDAGRTRLSALPDPTRPDPTTEPNGSVEGPRKRGTRLPDDWTLPDDWAEFASSLGLTRLDVEREAAKFADFWHAKAGRDAAKLDWAGTWRNWARRAAESKLTVVSQPMGYGWRG